MKANKAYSAIKKMDNHGLLGFVISESINEMDNSYEDIGMNLDMLIDENPDQIDFIENVVSALTGYCFETIKNKMEYNRDYYENL